MQFLSLEERDNIPPFLSVDITDMNAEFIAMLDYLEREKGIKRETLIEAISNALLTAGKKSIVATRELRIDINPKNGQIRALAKLIVADPVENVQEEISLAKARLVKPDAQVGEEVEVEVTPRDFGRIAAQTARQAMMQRIRQAEKEMIYDEFKDRAGEIVSGTVRRFERSDVIVDLGKFEAVMPAQQRVTTEEYSVGDRIRAYVVAVENGARGPEIILSRSHTNFVRRLFEIEVNEIADRTVELKAIAREAGFRTKVAVHSADDKVDPVGACVGIRGARVKNIVRELNNEKVDIIRWNEDPKEFAIEAMKPAKIRSITLDEPTHTIQIRVDKDQLATAIGKRGQNARLTSRLTGWEIDIQEDRSQEQAFENQIEKASAEFVDVLGLEVESAQALTRAGFTAVEVLLDAEPQDIADAAGIDLEKATSIIEAARKHEAQRSEATA